jgi:hypothetical protein
MSVHLILCGFASDPGNSTQVLGQAPPTTVQPFIELLDKAHESKEIHRKVIPARRADPNTLPEPAPTSAKMPRWRQDG